jgi:hypothetical protein
MVSFQTKNPNLGTILRVLQYKNLVYFVTIWSILRPLEIFMAIWYILWSFGKFFPVLVFCWKKNLAALQSKPCRKVKARSLLLTAAMCQILTYIQSRCKSTNSLASIVLPPLKNVSD